jgi:hypothetical protein
MKLAGIAALLSALLAAFFLPACGSSGGAEEDADADGVDTTLDVAVDDAPDAPDVETAADADADADVEARDEAAPREDVSRDAPDWGLPCPDPAAEFAPADPGMHTFFTIAEAVMMGMTIDTAAGGFLPAAREDFKPDTPSTIPLDTCLAGGEPPAPRECTTSAECSPEQTCVPETDASGNPIPDTGVCETTRVPVDVGPFTCTGFATDQTFAYNAGQNGAYISTADGTLPAGAVVYDAAYECTGDGSATAGLGAYRLWLYLPPQLELTAPPLVTTTLPFPILEIDATADLALEWTGGDGAGELSLTLSSRTGSVACRVLDDGAFTIPAAMVEAAALGDAAFLNMLEVRRERDGVACGEGLTDAEVTSLEALVLNVKKLAPATP